jgi:hypothetical protein
MPEDDKAQTAAEQTDAELTSSADPIDPEMEKGFDDEAARAGDPEDTAPVKKVETPPPEAKPEKAETPPPPVTEPKKDDVPPVELTAIQKAEAEGAKLAEEPVPDAAKPPEQKSVLELMPPEYKDAGDIIQTDAFKTWYEKQPKHIQNLATSGGVDGACSVIDFFRSHVASVAAKAAESTPAGARRLLAGLEDVEMVQADGSKIKVGEYLKDMGDMGEAIAVIADQVRGKPGVELSRIEKLESELADLRWMEAVTMEHSDARKIFKSQGWADFTKTASPAIKRLINSGAVEHTVLALDAFKETQVAAAKSKQAETGKNRTIALHSDTARGRSVEKTKAPDDFEDGFELGSK